MLRLHFKNNESPDVDLTATRLTIGRDPKNDVVLKQDGISGFHAEIHTENDRSQLVDLGSANGSYVNGKKVSGRRKIKAWDSITLDVVDIEVVDTEGRRPTVVRPAVSAGSAAGVSATAKTSVRPAVGGLEATRAASGNKPRLVGTAGAISGKTFDIPGNVTIGRSAENDIVIEDTSVSGNHARLKPADGGWVIEDLSSTNGVYVNGSKVKRNQLKDGDRVRLGKAELRFEHPGAGAESTAVFSTEGLTGTTVTPVQSKGVPAWVYGLVGFVIVGLGAGAFLYKDKLFGDNPSGFRLQATEVWNKPLPNSRSGPATPVIADINKDKFLDVIVGDSSGAILALDGQQGKSIFEFQLSGRILAPLVTTDMNGDGVADIIATSDAGLITAVAFVDGKPKALWKSPDDLNPGQIVNRPALRDLNADGIPEVLVPTANKGLVALDGARGWELWNTAGRTRGRLQTRPLVADINRDGAIDIVTVSDTGQVLAVTPSKDRPGKSPVSPWAIDLAAVDYASPAYIRAGEQGWVIVATRNDGVVALNAANGRTAWHTRLNKNFYASPVTTDATGNGIADVVVVATNGDIHVLESATGDEIWNLALGAEVRATPALFDVNGDGFRDLIILDVPGNLYIVDMNRGRVALKLAIAPGDQLQASPVMGDLANDGLAEVVMATRNGRINTYNINRTAPRGKAIWPMFLGRD